MVVLADVTLLGLAAIVSALSGAICTIFGLRIARRDQKNKSEAECRERLQESRAESEALAKELHELKMTDYGAR